MSTVTTSTRRTSTARPVNERPSADPRKGSRIPPPSKTDEPKEHDNKENAVFQVPKGKSTKVLVQQQPASDMRGYAEVKRSEEKLQKENEDIKAAIQTKNAELAEAMREARVRQDSYDTELKEKEAALETLQLELRAAEQKARDSEKLWQQKLERERQEREVALKREQSLMRALELKGIDPVSGEPFKLSAEATRMVTDMRSAFDARLAHVRSRLASKRSMLAGAIERVKAETVDDAALLRSALDAVAESQAALLEMQDAAAHAALFAKHPQLAIAAASRDAESDRE